MFVPVQIRKNGVALEPDPVPVLWVLTKRRVIGVLIALANLTADREITLRSVV